MHCTIKAQQLYELFTPVLSSLMQLYLNHSQAVILIIVPHTWHDFPLKYDNPNHPFPRV